MNVLITGGTGTIGRKLSLILSKKGDRIFVLDRVKKENEEKIFYIESDLCNEQKDISKIDVVYHLAANLNEQDPNMYYQNIQMTKNIIEMSKNAGVKRLVFMSSSGVLGETDVPSTEDMPYNALTKYEESKVVCEQMLKESGLSYTIIRASILLAPNNIWRTIIGAAKKGFPIIGNGENKFHLSYIDDVASLLVLVKDNQKANNEIFHVATRDIPTYKEVYQMICDELKCKMTDSHKSPWLVKFVLMFNGNSVINKHTVDRLIRNRQLSIEKAKIKLDFEPKYDTRKALKETIKYLKLIRLGYSEHEIAEMSLIK